MTLIFNNFNFAAIVQIMAIATLLSLLLCLLVSLIYIVKPQTTLTKRALAIDFSTLLIGCSSLIFSWIFEHTYFCTFALAIALFSFLSTIAMSQYIYYQTIRKNIPNH